MLIPCLLTKLGSIIQCLKTVIRSVKLDTEDIPTTVVCYNAFDILNPEQNGYLEYITCDIGYA